MNYYAIIVAGGTGNRMNNSIPKQFLLLDGHPIIMYAIEVFHNCTYKPNIIVVLAQEMHGFWRELCATYNFQIPYILADSGPQRFHSVQSGLKHIDGDGIVAIHDAARPLVSSIVVENAYRVASEKGNCVVGLFPVDSIRSINEDGSSSAVNRNSLMLIQTPQTFIASELMEAYKMDYQVSFTDDASVMESFGTKINIIEGNRENIKITFPEDIAIANLFIKKRS
jgi:2-C-methyl-D-erythritol 4-phosphate cytidylyltransferase